MVALLLFPIAWTVTAWQVVYENTGILVTIISVALIPLYLAAALLLSERFVLLWRAWKAWRGTRNLTRLGPKLAQGRQTVVATVAAAVPDPARIDLAGPQPSREQGP